MMKNTNIILAITLVCFLSKSLAQKIVSSPQQILFEENESVLWCQFEDNRP